MDLKGFQISAWWPITKAKGLKTSQGWPCIHIDFELSKDPYPGTEQLDCEMYA